MCLHGTASQMCVTAENGWWCYGSKLWLDVIVWIFEQYSDIQSFMSLRLAEQLRFVYCNIDIVAVGGFFVSACALHILCVLQSVLKLSDWLRNKNFKCEKFTSLIYCVLILLLASLLAIVLTRVMGVCYRLYPDLFVDVTDHVVVNRDIFSEQNFRYKHHAPVFCPLSAQIFNM